MRRLLPLALLLAALAPDAASAASKEYTTGSLRLVLPAGRTVERAVRVPDAGPVTFVRVAFKIVHPSTRDLKVSLVSPKGTVVPLVVNRGSGANFGENSSTNGCNGALTQMDSDMDTNPIAEGDSPFTDAPYKAEGRLAGFYRQDARGRWKLRVENAGAAGTLRCFRLELSRAVTETMSASRGSVKASVSFVERNFLYSKVRVTITRRGEKKVDAPLTALGCRDCDFVRPTGISVRDLDGGEPEVVLELYTGGAHCCSVTLISRYDARRAAFRHRIASWGNYGYRLVDLDRDGLPEFEAFDELFVYRFTAYVFSAAPPKIVRYRAGLLVDVTREFPKLVEKSAAELRAVYVKERGNKDVDLRGFVAAYVATLYLLDRGAQAQAFLQTALRRGDLSGDGGTSGRQYIADLMRFLRAAGYVDG